MVATSTPSPETTAPPPGTMAMVCAVAGSSSWMKGETCQGF